MAEDKEDGKASKDMADNVQKAAKGSDAIQKALRTGAIAAKDLASFSDKYQSNMKFAEETTGQIVANIYALNKGLGIAKIESDKTQGFMRSQESAIKSISEKAVTLGKTASQRAFFEQRIENMQDNQKTILEAQAKAQGGLYQLQVARETSLRGAYLSQAAEMKLMVSKGAMTEKDYKKQLEILKQQQDKTEELENQLKMQEEIAAEILDIKDNTESWGKSLNKAWATSKAIANDPKAMGALTLQQLNKHGKKAVETFHGMRESGMSAGQAADASFKAFSLNAMMGLSDTKGAIAGLQEEFGAVSGFSSEVVDDIGHIAHEMGISGQEAGKMVAQTMKMTGASAEQATHQLEVTNQLAKQAGLNPGALTKEMAQNMGNMSRFTKGGVDAFAKIAIEAKKIGVELSTSVKMADSLLDFESSIEKQMEASVLLGKELNFDKARQLALEGKSVEAAKEMLSQIGGIEEFNSMNVVQQKALADSMGMSVEELQKAVNGQEAMNEAVGEGVDAEKESLYATLEKGAAIIGMAKEYGGFALSALQFGKSLISGKAKEYAMDAAHWMKEKAQAAWRFMFGKKLAAQSAEAAKKGAGGALKGSVGGGKDMAGKAGADAGKAGKAAGPAKGLKGVSKGLKDLASGIAAFGKPKVILGGLVGLPATAIGLVTMVAGIPSMIALAALGVPAGAGLTGLSKGVEKMAKGKVMMGAVIIGALAVSLVALGAAAILFAAGGAAGTMLMVIALYALVGAIALMGMLSGSGLGWLGVALVLAIGVALLLMGAAVYLAATGMAILVEAFTGLFSVISMENILPIFLLGPALTLAGLGMMVFAASLVVLGVAALIAAPGLMFLALSLMLLGASLLVVGLGLLLLGEGLEPFQNFLGFFAETGLTVATALMLTAVGFFVFAGALLALAFAAFFGTPALIGLGAAMLMLGLGVKFASEGLVKIAEVLPAIAEGAMGLGVAAWMMSVAAGAVLALGLAGLVAFPGLVLGSLGLGMLAFTMGLFAAAVTAAMPGVALLMQLGAMGEMFALIAESMWHMAAGIAAFATAGLLTLPTIMGLIALAFVAPILTLLGDSINYDLQNNAPPPVSADDAKMDMVIEELRQIKMAFQTPGVINMDGQKVGDVLGLAVSNSGIN